MSSGFRSNTQTLVSVSNVAPPPAQCLSVLLIPLELSRTVLKPASGLDTLKPFILHPQMQKQCTHTNNIGCSLHCFVVPYIDNYYRSLLPFATALLPHSSVRLLARSFAHVCVCVLLESLESE